MQSNEIVLSIEKFQQGDIAAFNDIYRLSLDVAYRFAKPLLQSEEDIEDVLQNSYVRVYNNLHALRETEKFNAWLKILVENECKAFLKKKKPLIWIGEQNKFENLVAEQNIIAVPDEVIEKVEIYTALSQIIDALPEEKRACIKMFYFDEMRINEIAVIQGVSPGTVKTRIFNSKKKIAKELNKQFPGDPRLKSMGISE